MYLRIQFFDENSNIIKPSIEQSESRKKFEYEMFKIDKYTSEEKVKLSDQLTHNSYVDLDLSLTAHKAFFELVNFNKKIELWDGEYEIIDKVFRAISPKALWVTVKKINKN